MSLFKTLFFCVIATTTLPSVTLAQSDRQVVQLNSDVKQLVADHFDQLEKVDKRDVLRALRSVIYTFELYDIYPAGTSLENKYYTADCRLNGNTYNAKVGPAISVENLKLLCKNTLDDQYKDKTFLEKIASETYPVDAYLTADCRLNGNTYNAKVGPSKSVETLYSECQNTLDENYRNKVYLEKIEVLDI